MRKQVLRVFTRNVNGPCEHRRGQLPRLGRTLANARVDLLENTRHANQHGRTHLAQVWSNGLQRLRKIDRHAAMQIHVHRLAFKNMRQRQHRKRDVVFSEFEMARRVDQI